MKTDNNLLPFEEAINKYMFQIYEFHKLYPNVKVLGIKEFWNETSIDYAKINTTYTTAFNKITYTGERGPVISINNRTFGYQFIIEEL